MSLKDPVERTQNGIRTQSEVQGAPAAEPTTLLQSAWRDFVYAEIWTRPGLDRRSRFLIAIAGSACEGVSPDIIDGYVRGALTTGDLTLGELREGALHLSVYGGWARGTYMDDSITRVQNALGLEPVAIAPVRDAPWDPVVRQQQGAKEFEDVMVFPGPKPISPYLGDGILNFVFGEMWCRPGLDQRSRRWITMVGVAESSSRIPIRTHTYAAMASGNATVAEMQEFVLQYAVHGGWPKGSVMQATVFEMGRLVTEGLPYQD